MSRWGPGPVPGDDEAPKRKRRRPQYGGEMDALLDILADFAAVHAEKVARVQALYPHADVTAVSAYVYDARRAYVRGEDTRAERLTHKFIVTAHRSAPEFEPPAKPSLWARFWPWLAFVYTPTAALLTATEVWK